MTAKEVADKWNRNKNDEPESKEPEILDGIICNCMRVNLRKEPKMGLDCILAIIEKDSHINVYPDKSTDDYWFVKTIKHEGFIHKNYVKIS